MARKNAGAPPPERSKLPEIGLALVAVVLVGAFFFLRRPADRPPAAVPYETAPAETAATPPAETPAPVASQATTPPPAPQSTSTAAEAKADAWPSDLPPLPIGNYDLPRPVSQVRAAFLFAARHPEVEKYVPCYCGCNLMGHRDNEDCFVSSRDAHGHVTGWEAHGLT
ncbi:MAG TPA: PCYCGC motif-containing (lipo)protein [Vicinamibacterales bacterium]|nr:PCYCGC motif-containing (lipo)protein [Vicinamibacterales bacterium]